MDLFRNVSCSAPRYQPVQGDTALLWRGTQGVGEAGLGPCLYCMQWLRERGEQGSRFGYGKGHLPPCHVQPMSEGRGSFCSSLSPALRGMEAKASRVLAERPCKGSTAPLRLLPPWDGGSQSRGEHLRLRMETPKLEQWWHDTTSPPGPSALGT